MSGNGKIGSLAPVSVLIYGCEIEGLTVDSVYPLLLSLKALFRLSIKPMSNQ